MFVVLFIMFCNLWLGFDLSCYGSCGYAYWFVFDLRFVECFDSVVGFCFANDLVATCVCDWIAWVLLLDCGCGFVLFLYMLFGLVVVGVCF